MFHVVNRLSLALLAVTVLMGCDSALMREVSYYERLGQPEQARNVAARTVQSQPANSEAHFLLGRAHLALGDYEAARASFDQANARTARFTERITFLLQSAYREAMTEGATAYQAGDFPAASEHFRSATRIAPDALDAHRAFGHALVQAGDLATAVTAYEAALLLAPEDFEILNNLAELTTLLAEYPRAIAYAERVYTLDPAFRPGLRRLAFVEERLGQLDPAESHYRLLVDGGHTQADARNFAFLLYNKQKYAEALPHLQLLAETGQPDASVLRLLTEVYLALEDYPRAAETGILLHERIPDDRDIVSNLIRAYERMGDQVQVEHYRAQLARMEAGL